MTLERLLFLSLEVKPSSGFSLISPAMMVTSLWVSQLAIVKTNAPIDNIFNNLFFIVYFPPQTNFFDFSTK